MREFADLVRMLCRDTRSYLFARVHKWDYPVAQEFFVMAATRDAIVLAHTPKKNRGQFKPFPLPFKTGKRFGGKEKNVHRTAGEVRSLLRPYREV